MRRKIALIGPYPPPIGGVSIHVQRLCAYLQDKGAQCTIHALATNDPVPADILPATNTKTLLRQLITSRAEILHYHGHLWHQRASLTLFKLLGKKIICTFHSLREDVSMRSIVRERLIAFTLRFSDALIATNVEIAQALEAWGAHPNKISVIPAFIPPLASDGQTKNFPSYLSNFIETHSPVLIANAYKIAFFQDQDLYGLDMCVELCARLKPDYPQIGFICCLPSVGDQQYLALLKTRVQAAGINANFLFVTEKNLAFVPLLEKADLFLRPTNTDGDALSVREAIMVGTPVVASDVIPRPEGAQVFRTRDNDDLYNKTRRILQKHDQHLLPHAPADSDGFSFAEKILAIYDRI